MAEQKNRATGSSVSSTGSPESMRDKAATFSITMLAVGTQLMFRAMLLLRSWNY